jgi:uncharacterized protein
MPGPWQQKAAGHEVFINLAGSSIFGRWNDKVKREMRESRIRTTDHLVTAMGQERGGKKRLLSASAIGYYGFRGDEPLDENALPGNDFLASLSVEWEAAASNARKLGAIVSICRFGIVLGKNGGVLQKLVPLFRSSLGTSLGRGDQWMSWIHEIDLADILLFLLGQPDLEGPINCTAPHPVRNREMTRTLAEILGTRRLLPSVPGFMVQLLMGEFGNVILKGQKVLPRRLLEKGFPFQFPTLKAALEDILKMHSERNTRSLTRDERATAR